MTFIPTNSELGLFRDEPHLVVHHLMNMLEVTNEDLGNKLGISKQAVYKIRSGTSKMSAARLKRVADGLGVPSPLLMTTPAAAIRWVLDNMEADDGGDGGAGAEVTTLHTPAGVVQWDYSDNLLKAA